MRSVGVRYWLHDKSVMKCDVIAAGAEANSKDTIDFLAAWADWVIISSAEIGPVSCPRLLNLPKTIVVDLGPDIWRNAVHPELQDKISAMMPPVVERMINSK